MKSIQNIGISRTMPFSKSFLVIITVMLLITSCHNKNWGYCTPPTEIRVTPPSKIFSDVVLNGVVKDREGLPLDQVQVVLANEVVAITDAQGKFAVDKKNVDITSRLTFSCIKENYNNASFSYHYQMDNKNFEIAMGKPCICKVDEHFCNCIKDINFEYSNTITNEIEEQLNEVITCMKNNPECNITLSFAFTEDKRTAGDRINKIKNYLTNNGINENRITTNSEKAVDDKSRVQIIVNH
jgi:hypothetical protein